jgi:hypothetical protein
MPKYASCRIANPVRTYAFFEYLDLLEVSKFYNTRPNGFEKPSSELPSELTSRP